jgi:hypothetical protein
MSIINDYVLVDELTPAKGRQAGTIRRWAKSWDLVWAGSIAVGHLFDPGSDQLYLRTTRLGGRGVALGLQRRIAMGDYRIFGHAGAKKIAGRSEVTP